MTSPTGQDAAASAPAPALTLRNRAFAGTEVTESGTRRPLVDGTELLVDFQWHEPTHSDRLGWSAGCNRIGAAVDITDDRLHLEGDVTSSLVGCPDAVLSQEDWFTEFMRTDPGWRLEADFLILSSGNTTVTLQERTSMQE